MSLLTDLVARNQTGLSMPGEWRTSSDGGTFDVLDPATAQPLTMVANGTADDAMDAIEAVSAAAPAWSATTPQRRSELLRQAFELMIARSDQLAELITAETGEPLAEAKGEATFAGQNLARSMRISEALEYGMVLINRGFYSDPAAPFGGVKQSGIGREGSHEGMMEFLETKYIAADW